MILVAPKYRLRTRSFVGIVAAAKPSSARTPAPTVYGPFLTSQAPSTAGTLPSKVFVTGAPGATPLSPKWSTMLVRASTAPVRALTMIRYAVGDAVEVSSTIDS